MKTTPTVMGAVMLTCVLTLVIGLGTAQGSGNTLYVEPRESSVNVGASFTINIDIENAVNLFSYEAKLGFNKTILEPVTVEEGPFIEDRTTSPMGTFFLLIIKEDYVQVACVTQGNYPGVSGSGTLFNITFNALKAGISDLHLYDSILLDPQVTEIDHDSVDGSVSAALVGDVNLDGIVNVLDLTLVSLSYGAFEGEPDYNPVADLNHDGIVDLKDIWLVARNLGKH